jgi:hypothetical protein
MRALLAAILIVATAPVVLAEPTTPRLSPFFTGFESGPAFMVECLNDTDHDVSSADRRWTRLTIRLNGTVHGPDPNLMGPGLSMPVPSGSWWRGIYELRQTDGGVSRAVAAGALVRIRDFRFTLPRGRHTLAVQCAGVWSEELVFYLEEAQGRD